MRKIKACFICSLLIVSLTGCASNQSAVSSQSNASSQSNLSEQSTPSNESVVIQQNAVSYQSSVSDNIPTNVSVNAAWGGGMCEASGFVYYISDVDSKTASTLEPRRIVRMKPDGSDPTIVSEVFYRMSDLAADSSNIYFYALAQEGIYTLYSLPLNGGKAQKVAEGRVRSLQCVNGKLYWIDYERGDPTILIKCVNPDGSDLKTLLELKASTLIEGQFHFAVTDSGIYYSKFNGLSSDYSELFDIYHTDLSGGNPVKLNHDPLGSVDGLFYDQGKLYFLMQNDFKAAPFTDSVQTLGQGGKPEIILNKVGYFPQDFSTIEFCGISNSIIYYFILTSDASRTNQILMDLHQYDIDKNSDSVLLHDIDMGDSAVGTVTSLRGKSFQSSLSGMYIIGNDIYYVLWLPAFLRMP